MYSSPSISFSGIKLPMEPSTPEDWTVKISGGAKGTFDPFVIEPYEVDGDLIERVHTFSGSGSIQGVSGAVTIEGLFFLTKTNLVYGIYKLSGGLSENGSFSGKATLPSKFSLKAISETGTKFNIDGLALLDQREEIFLLQVCAKRSGKGRGRINSAAITGGACK